MGSYLEDVPVRTASADYPELCVEWLPTVGPGAADGEWCDITGYVMSGSTFIGRQYELDQFQAGTCQLTLVASTRLFDPEFTSGPFYPWLIPMRQLRVSASWDGVRYPIWRGYVTDWGQSIPAADSLIYTTIEAKDAFVVLEQIRLPSSAWALEVQRDDPSLWFRLGETDTARVTDSSAGGNYGIYDNVVQGAQGLVPNDADGAVDFGTNYDPADSRVTIQNPSLISGYPFTFSAVFQVEPINLTRVMFASLVEPDGVPGFYIAVQSGTPYGGQVFVAVFDGTNSRGVYSGIIVDDGLPHHVALAFVSSTSYLLYVDGVDRTNVFPGSGTTSFPGNPPNGYTIGNYADVLFGTNGFKGIIDEVCVWDGRALSAERVALHSLAAKSAWDGDDTGARVTRFLDAIDWPATLRDIDTGISILGRASWSAGASALSVMQDWANTEYGLFHVGPSGKIVWRSRHSRYLDTNANTSQATFGDGHSAADLVYVADGFALQRDEALIRNPVTASRAGGVSVTVKDQTLIEQKYGTRTWASPGTQDQLDSAVRDRALWLLARYKDQSTRLVSMNVKPRRDVSYWPEILALIIGDRITVKRQPLGSGNEIATDQWIESVRHTFSPRDWSTTFSGSPVEEQSYLILDDASLGLLDTGILSY